MPFEKAVFANSAIAEDIHARTAARLKEVPDAPMKTNDAALRERIKALVVQCTSLRIIPSEIKNDQPLVEPASGLRLDSIDVLELVVGLQKNYGVTIPGRDTGQRVLRPVTTIAESVKASGRKL